MNSDFTVLPAQFMNDRIFVCPVTEDGTRLTLYTDTGGGELLIDPDVANQLNLPYRHASDGENERILVPFPTFQTTACIPPGSEEDELIVLQDMSLGGWGLHGPWGQGFLGQPWFANRIWKLDYQNGEMGYLPKESRCDVTGFRAVDIGFQLDDEGNPGSKAFPRIQASVDGELLDFLFDTGATAHLTEAAQQHFFSDDTPFRGTCFIVQSVFDKWRLRHPDWVVIENADKLGKQAMIEVPTVGIAGFEVGPVWFTRRMDSDFYDFVSQWTDKRVSGALGGSLFKYFSIIIDYPNSMAYFKR